MTWSVVELVEGYRHEMYNHCSFTFFLSGSMISSSASNLDKRKDTQYIRIITVTFLIRWKLVIWSLLK